MNLDQEYENTWEEQQDIPIEVGLTVLFEE
jgi:hypothetical protein